ncbi:hypothetical protein EDB80DRAFT_757989 [Ilyonectria destructans]|nr:hypothetical protein EDB80DRAFT_596099 [Ilyonectria destructans]KAH6973359.1 hypothetical protein EDB80DRAFT_757989 [Ilyonectria destructans]
MRVPLTDEQITEGRRELEDMDLETGYDEAATESYAIFKQLRDEGFIEKNVKFQVSLPTIANVVGVLIEEDFRPLVEPVYEKALFKSLQNIQDLIPHEDLAIQIDLGMDLAYWENKVFQPWFPDIRGHVVDYIVRMISRIDHDIDLGIHYCYGDMNHQHFTEPTSLGPITDLHHHIMMNSPRSIEWIHCPVPLSAMDRLGDYYAPLALLCPQLIQDKTKLYLGLVHPHDLEGTRARIAAAESVVQEFGVATECGWGRISNREDVDSIMDICQKVSCHL